MVAGAIVVGVISGPHQGQPAPGPAGGSTHGASATASPAPAHGGPSGSNGDNGNKGSSRSGGGPGLGPAGSTGGGGATSPGAGQSPGAPSSPGAVGPAGPGGSSTSPASSSPAAGTLAVSTGQIRLVSVNGTATSTFTITARGGPVSYSISVGSALLGAIGVSPASGTLAAGASATITVTAHSLVAVAGQLTVNPGGHAITVVVSVKL
jgi:hypothetical protein